MATKLDEILHGTQQGEGRSTDRVIRLLNDIKNRLDVAVDYEAMADKLGVTTSQLLKPKSFTLDLSTAHDEQAFNLSGSKIIISEITGEAGLTFSRGDDPIPLEAVHQIPNRNGFNTFYISNTAQKTGTSLSGLVTNIGGLDPADAPLKIDPVHLDRPWGTFVHDSGSSVNISAGGSVTLTDKTGFGWLNALIINMDYNGLQVLVYRDGDQAFPSFTPQELFDTYGLDTPANNLPYLSAYDTTNDEYIFVLDPPNQYHFNESLRVEVDNPDGVAHNVANWSQITVK